MLSKSLNCQINDQTFLLLFSCLIQIFLVFLIPNIHQAVYADVHIPVDQSKSILSVKEPINHHNALLFPPSVYYPASRDYTSIFSEFNQSKIKDIIVKSLKIKSGDTLAGRLRKEKIKENDIQSVLQSIKSVYDPRELRIGQVLFLYMTQQKKQLIGITTKTHPDQSLIVTRTYKDHFNARNLSIELKKEIAVVKGRIENSFYLDSLNKGATDNIIVQFANLYAYSVDFQREIHKGDEFELVFERYVNHSGKIIKTGKLLYSMLKSRNKTMPYWYFKSSKNHVGYYDLNGNSARKFLMKTPINGARLTSRFGRRKHPILGYTRQHKGVDFGAPSGTPVFAAGKGIIEKIGYYGGYGKYIRIKHANQYKTAYAHLSRFARRLKSSSRVSQGQIIGYVGSTGRSTGPHLHYEIHYKNKAVNPLKIRAPLGHKLNSKEKKMFDLERLKIEALRKKLASDQAVIFVNNF